jgi:hypothetical protein
MKDRLYHISINEKNLKRYYKPIKYPSIPLSVSDIYITTTAGDRLDNLAHQFYQDVRLWWVIVGANRDMIRRDSFSLKPGIEIRIPLNTEKILLDFHELNKD